MIYEPENLKVKKQCMKKEINGLLGQYFCFGLYCYSVM